jgi:hypothetical protein
MDGLKPSILKQLLPNRVGLDNDLFLSMFLIRQLPSLREAVGARDNKTATAMVRVADALWDAHGGSNRTVTAAMASCNRSPHQAKGQRVTDGDQCLLKSHPICPQPLP